MVVQEKATVSGQQEEDNEHRFMTEGEMDNQFERVRLKVERQLINPFDYADKPAELEVQQELRRLGMENGPKPQVCLLT